MHATGNVKNDERQKLTCYGKKLSERREGDTNKNFPIFLFRNPRSN